MCIPAGPSHSFMANSHHEKDPSLPRGESQYISECVPGQPTPSGRSTAELMLGPVGEELVSVSRRWGINPTKYMDIYRWIDRWKDR